MQVICENKNGCNNKDCLHAKEHDCTPNCSLHCETWNGKTVCKEIKETR